MLILAGVLASVWWSHHGHLLHHQTTYNSARAPMLGRRRTPRTTAQTRQPCALGHIHLRRGYHNFHHIFTQLTIAHGVPGAVWDPTKWLNRCSGRACAAGLTRALNARRVFQIQRAPLDMQFTARPQRLRRPPYAGYNTAHRTRRARPGRLIREAFLARRGVPTGRASRSIGLERKRACWSSCSMFDLQSKLR